MSYSDQRRALDTFADFDTPEIVFVLEGKILLSMSVEGVFPGEIRETRELLALEQNVSPNAISVEIG